MRLAQRMVSFQQIGVHDAHAALGRAADFADLGAVADAVAHALLERVGNAVYPTDGLEHRRLLVELPLEVQMLAEARFQHGLEVQRIGQLAGV